MRREEEEVMEWERKGPWGEAEEEEKGRVAEPSCQALPLAEEADGGGTELKAEEER